MKNILSLFVFCMWYSVAFSNGDTLFFSTNGGVFDMALEGNDLYIGGDFTQLGVKTGCMAQFEPGKTTPVGSFPFIGDPVLGNKNNRVSDFVPDGKGGWYVVGDFTRVGNDKIAHLAHIGADNKPDVLFSFNIFQPAWYTTSTGSTTMGLGFSKLFLSDNYLYIGGTFKTSAGHYRLCRINLSNNTIDNDWKPQPDTKGSITAFERYNNMIFVAGSYVTINGVYTPGVAALDVNTGEVIPGNWNSSAESTTSLCVLNDTLYIGAYKYWGSPPVYGKVFYNSAFVDFSSPYPLGSLGNLYNACADGNGGWFVSGGFQELKSHKTYGLAHVGADFSVDTLFTQAIQGISLSSAANMLAADAKYVYAAGSGYAKYPGNIAIRFDRKTGAFDTAWVVTFDGVPGSIFVNDTAFFVTGNFSRVQQMAKPYFAAVSVQTGLLYPNTFNTASQCRFVGGNRTHIYLVNEGTDVLRFDKKGAIDTSFHLNRFSGPVTNIDQFYVNDTLLVLTGWVGYTINNGPPMYRHVFMDLRNNTKHSMYDKFNAINKHYNYANSFSQWFAVTNRYFVYSCNELDTINGTYHPKIMAMDIASGRLADYNPKADGYFARMVPSGSGFLAMGNFMYFNSQSGLFLGYNLKERQFLDPIQSGHINSIKQYGSKLLVTGSFQNFAKKPTEKIAIYDPATKLVEPFALNITGFYGEVLGAEISGNTMYLYGNFERVSNQLRNSFAAIDLNTKTLLPWDPGIDQNANYNLKIGISGNRILMNGGFSMAGTVKCDKLAKVNLLTREIYHWGPEALMFASGGYDYGNTYVRRLLIDGDRLIVGGYFNKYNGTPAPFLIALDKTNSGLLTGFKPEFTSTIEWIQKDGANFVVGGSFTSVNGEPRDHLAVIDGVTGANLPFAPKFKTNSNTRVYSIANDGHSYVLAGQYLQKQTDVTTRNYQLARVDKTSGEVLNTIELPGKSYAHELHKQDSLIFFLTTYNGNVAEKPALGALSLNTFSIKNWMPDFKGLSQAMLFSGSRLFVTGGSVYETITNAYGTTINEKRDYTRLLVTDTTNDTTFVNHPILIGDNTKRIYTMLPYKNSLLIGGNFYKNGLNQRVGGVDMIESPNNLFTPEVTNFSPKVIGNKGKARYVVYGKGFAQGTTVAVKNSTYQFPVLGVSHEGDTKLYGELPLSGVPAGDYDLVVSVPGDTVITLRDAMHIEPAEKPEIWVNLTGPDVLTRGKPTTFYLNIGNRGNVNAYMVPVLILADADKMNLEMVTEMTHQYAAGEKDTIPNQFVVDMFLGEPGNKKLMPLLIPYVPANSSGFLKLKVTNYSSESARIEVYSQAPLYTDPDIDFKSATMSNGLGRSFVNCAYNFLDAAPGYECVKSAWDNFHKKSIDKYLDSGNPNLSAAELTESAGKVVLDCIGDVNPASKAVKWIYKLYKYSSKAADGWSKFSDCYEFGKDLTKDVTKWLIPVWSSDPNDKYGPLGAYGSHFSRSDKPWSFLITYENVDSAPAAAQVVRIVDTIDTHFFDMETFELVSAGFGDTSVVYPNGLKTKSTNIDLRPSKNCIVNINNTFDASTGIVEWIFTALDPVTMELTENANGGFLPPNKKSPEGEGFVMFNITPKTNIKTNDAVQNRAMIIFDWNEPIFTPVYRATVDNSAPQSSVTALPQEIHDTTFVVHWSGNDSGSAIAWYDVFVSENNGEYLLWKNQIQSTSAPFSGSFGSTYAFYSVATDSAKNKESAPVTFDTKTMLKRVDDGLNEILAANRYGLRVFPNPAGERATIEYCVPYGCDLRIEVVNLAGIPTAMVTNGYRPYGLYKAELNLRNLNAGAYFVRLMKGPDLIADKLLIVAK